MGALIDEEFDNTGLQSDELNIATRLNWAAGRVVGFALALERSERDTSDGQSGHTENRAFLTMRFRLGEALTSARQ